MTAHPTFPLLAHRLACRCLALAGLSFPWRKFSARLLVNHTGEHLVGYSTDRSRLR